jgi:Flp pilus assembly CpaE family ATPase
LFTHAHSATEPLQLTTEQVLSLTQCVAQPGHSVVVDCGHAVTAVTRPIIEQADQLVLCLRPERVALAVTKQRLPQLQALLFSHTQLRIVLFDFTGQINIPKQAVEKFLGHPVMGIIPVSPQVINQAVNKGIPLVQLNPQAKTAVFIRQIAQQLVKV